MPELNLKPQIEQKLRQFATLPLVIAARQLFNTLGYQSEKAFDLTPNSPATFLAEFAHTQPLQQAQALFDQWRTVDFLFQLTDNEIRHAGALPLFNSKARWENTQIESYLLFALELTGDQYTRTQLASITRAVNRLFLMPVLLLFKHGETLTLAVINRRLHKRDESKDVLEKVTLIKDIRFATPHRAHIEILADLALPHIIARDHVANWVELHRAWMKTLDTKELNKRFYQELSHWYFWAMHEVTFPGAAMQADKQNLFQEEDKVREHTAKNLIRLLTRLLFVWFVKEKQLIPNELFDEKYIREHLIDGFEPRKRSNFDHKTQGSRYYRAILQNLFFATLNQVVDKREFRKDGQHRNVTTLMRYERYFKNPQAFLQLMEATVPFMNGGLFECLDAPDPVLKGPKGGDAILYEDGFSDRPDNVLCVPDYIFFGTGEQADLSEDLGDKKQKAVAVNGLINILKAYKFTIAENTPLEEDVALDPELLGQVFENLLASYNPETQTTARKQTGSFYTPREIVNYMVDESLKTYLKQKLETEAGLKPEEAEAGLAELVSYNEKTHRFAEQQTTLLINAIDTCKILDPACGSGAFPMGILHKLVHILHKLDPQNERWKERQIEKAQALDDATLRDSLIDDIETAFANNELDYGRKLYLIENCIYGVDIQPIAIQISKLRFFISLIVDQKVDKTKENFGIRPLPNLETKFVAANTLITIEKPQVGDFAGSLFDNADIKKLEDKLTEVRHRLFSAKTPHTKRKLREDDKTLREQMGALLMANGWGNASARQLAGWDPYNQNASADFFDPEWMFGVSAGFDVVIGNPPYISALDFAALYGVNFREKLNKSYSSAKGTYDIYVLFFERGMNLMNSSGSLIYITPNKYLSAKYAVALRELIIQKTAITQIVDISRIRVFEEAAVYPVITTLRKQKSLYSTLEVLLPSKSNPEKFVVEDFEHLHVSCSMLSLLPEHIWGFVLADNLKLLTKILKDTLPLSEWGNINATSTASEADMYGQFLVEYTTSDSLQVLNTGTIDKFASFWGYRQMTHSGKKFLKPYLSLTLANVSQRRRDMYRSPKVIFAKMAKTCEAYLDIKGEYASLNTNCFYNPKSSVDIRFIGAYCNSRLFMFFYEQFFNTLRMNGGYFQFQAPQLRVIPLKKIDYSQQLPIIRLVEHILHAKRANPAADVAALEEEIDRLIYQLYELTDEEITIVEGNK